MLKDALPSMKTTVPGPRTRELLEKRGREIPRGIHCDLPVAIRRGEGAMIEDMDDNVYLDWTGGVGVLNLGYSRPELVEAVSGQARKYFHVMMDVMTHAPYLDLAEKLNQIVPVRGDHRKTMFLNSGGECDETAIKVARIYTGRPRIMVFSGAYHGIAAKYTEGTDQKKSGGVGAFANDVCKAVFPNLYRRPDGMDETEAIAYYLKKMEEVFTPENPVEDCAAIIFEPVQGVGGLVPAPLEWVRQVRKFCDAHGILMICDEVQSGWARTGRMFGADYYAEAGAPPDMILTAKAIAGGLPLGSVTARDEIMDAVPAGIVGGTFCGNPVSCADALEVVRLMEEEDAPAKARHIGEQVLSAWQSWQKEYEMIGDCRGMGAMLGMELVHSRKGKEPWPEAVRGVIEAAVQRGLLLKSAGARGNVIRFLSPLCVTDAQVEAGLSIMKDCLDEVQETMGRAPHGEEMK